MKMNYIECACNGMEHTVRLITDPDDDYLPLYFEFHLVQWHPWYRRIWLGIKYIFGYKTKYGHYDTVCLEAEQANKIVAAIREIYP